jgi:hypothetical protein
VRLNAVLHQRPVTAAGVDDPRDAGEVVGACRGDARHRRVDPRCGLGVTLKGG